MKRFSLGRSALGSCIVAAIVAGCSAFRPVQEDMPQTTAGSAQILSRVPSSVAKSPIQHVVLAIQENRSFNDFFATFPGTDGTATGQAVANKTCGIAGGSIALAKMPLDLSVDLFHAWEKGYAIAYDGGKMDAFDDVQSGGKHAYECGYPYQYTDPQQIQPYWVLATQYALAEHMFTTQGSDSFSAHQDLIRGGTIVEPNDAMVDAPTCGDCHWGCDAPAGTYTHLITTGNQYRLKRGPFPCSNDFAEKYSTLRDLLDAKSVSWKYYVPPSDQINGKLLNAFDLVYPVRYGSEWNNNISTPETNILGDIADSALPAMSWVVPDAANSDHPGTKVDGEYVDDGPQWIATLVNAIGESPYWDSTVIVIVWDDWGGFYDNKGGLLSKFGGPGERVPALVISPYSRAGYISKTTYQFGSILKFVEKNWNLGTLGTTDVNVKSIIDCLNYKQTPIQFQPIQSSLGKSYFLHERHSYRAPDTDW